MYLKDFINKYNNKKINGHNGICKDVLRQRFENE